MVKIPQGINSRNRNANHPRRLLSAGEITRLSWSQVIRRLEDVPRPFQDRLTEITANSGTLPYIVHPPTFEGFLRREIPRLVLLQNHQPPGEIIVLEAHQERVVETRFRVDQIHAVESGCVLLNGWISFHGLDQEGIPAVRTVKFNAVNALLFQPFIDVFRRSDQAAGLQMSGPQLDISPQDVFQFLEPLNFKFMNYARRSVLPGDEIAGRVFQPEIRRPRLRLGGRITLWRVLCDAQLLILTQRELILIRDDPHSASMTAGVHHGGIWTFIPCRCIQGSRIQQGRQELSRLIVDLPCGESLDVPFETSRLEEFEALLIG